MKINRNGIIFRNAYAFTESKDQPAGNIGGCTLLWRFIWFGFWRTVINVLFIFFTIVMIILTPIRFAWSFLFGARLERRHLASGDSDAPVAWEWVESIPEGLLAICYQSRPIQHWPRIFGWRVLPVSVIGVCLALWGEYLLWNHSLQNVFSHGLGVYDKWDVLFVVQLALITVLACIAGVVLFVGRARESELGQLIRANYRSFKERTCPVVEIVG